VPIPNAAPPYSSALLDFFMEHVSTHCKGSKSTYIVWIKPCQDTSVKRTGPKPLPAPSKKPSVFSKLFAEIAKVGSREVGRAWVFALALGTVLVWAITGPFFYFSDTWQLVINTGTTIVTFLRWCS
jgi:hypothetical protein